MNVTWVSRFPNGHETGRFLTLDMGGTNLRVCDVRLSDRRRDFEQTQRKFKIPLEVKSGTAEELWDFVADRLESFLEEHPSGAAEGTNLPLALTFSFPVDQQNIRSGVLQHWTKKFNVSGVEGQDVVPQLEAALVKKVSSSSSEIISTRDYLDLSHLYLEYPRGCRCAYQRYDGNPHRFALS